MNHDHVTIIWCFTQLQKEKCFIQFITTICHLMVSNLEWSIFNDSASGFHDQILAKVKVFLIFKTFRIQKRIIFQFNFIYVFVYWKRGKHIIKCFLSQHGDERHNGWINWNKCWSGADGCGWMLQEIRKNDRLHQDWAFKHFELGTW